MKTLVSVLFGILNIIFLTDDLYISLRFQTVCDLVHFIFKWTDHADSDQILQFCSCRVKIRIQTFPDQFCINTLCRLHSAADLVDHNMAFLARKICIYHIQLCCKKIDCSSASELILLILKRTVYLCNLFCSLCPDQLFRALIFLLYLCLLFLWHRHLPFCLFFHTIYIVSSFALKIINSCSRKR